MKTLRTYINEYLNVNVKLQDKKFPALPIFDDIIEYFENNNFKILSYKTIGDTDADHYLKNIGENIEVPICIYDTNVLDITNLCWLKIRNIGNISKSNPMLHFYATLDKTCKDEHEIMKLANKIHANFIGYNLTTIESYNTWKEFKEVFYNTFKNSLNYI